MVVAEQALPDSPRPDVSVVIVSWNTRDLLADALRTLLSETQGVTMEVVVVDNGSEDGTSDFVRARYPDVELVSLPTNLGFTGGNNRGFDVAQGRHILLLNSDTIVLPSTVVPLVRFLDANPGAGCVGARHLNADGTLQRSIDDIPDLVPDILTYTELARLAAVERWLAPRSAWWSDHEETRTVGWTNGACMMVRREVIKQVGGFDERLFIYGDEVDWCHRMALAGWTVHFLPDAEVIHLGGQAMDKVPDRRTRLLIEGNLHFYREHHPRWKGVSLRAVVLGTAAIRMGAIVGMAVGERVGRPPSDRLWQFATRESVRTTNATMLRQWAQIMADCIRAGGGR